MSQKHHSRTEGDHNWLYRNGRADAHQRLDEAGWRKRKCKDGTFTVEGRIHWNPATGAWRAHDGSAIGTGVGEMMHFLRRTSRLRGEGKVEKPDPCGPVVEPHPHEGMHQVRLIAGRTQMDLGGHKGITSAISFSQGDVLACDGFWDARDLAEMLNRQAGGEVALLEKVA